MIGSGSEYEKEFEEMIGSLAQTTRQISDQVNDPAEKILALSAMLYSVAEERKNTNLIVRNLNSKMDMLLKEIEVLKKQAPATAAQTAALSDRDNEVLEFVKRQGRTCADTLQEKFKYKGKNAASARLSKLFHEGILEKEYSGRKVYYVAKK